MAGALQLNLEGRMTNAREDGAEEQTAVAIPVQLTADSKRLTTPTHYANQGMYALPKMGVGSSVKGGGRGGATFDPISISGCFNCDAKDHVMRDCKRPVDFIKAAQRKPAYWSKKRTGRPTAAAVLFAAMEKMNRPSANDGKVAKGETIDGLEELCYETLMTASSSSDAENDTGSGFEEGPSFRPGA